MKSIYLLNVGTFNTPSKREVPKKFHKYAIPDTFSTNKYLFLLKYKKIVVII